MNTLKWLFIDFDSYFASVEQHLHPHLRGKPVGVIPIMADTTSCIAASYEAKKYGVKTGTCVAEARKLCPGIQFVLAEHQAYVEYHKRFHEVINSVVPISETLSIDEVSCQLPTNWQDYEVVENLIHRLKSEITTGVSPWITCSIGSAPNRFLAKLASKYHKPNGYHIVTSEDIPDFLSSHQLRDLNGIGKNMGARLNAAGIYTVAQLYQCSEKTLHRIWRSVHGSRMYYALRGRDLASLPTNTSSIGHSHVLAPEKRVPHHAQTVLHRLLQKAARRLRTKHYVTANIQLALHYERGRKWGQEARFMETAESASLSYATQALWSLRPEPHELIYKISITFTKLKQEENYTLHLFTQPDPKRQALDSALDHLVTKYGKHAAYYGSAHGALASAPMRIAFSHIPDPNLEQ